VLRKELNDLKADFIATKSGSDTFKEELKTCQYEVKRANNKISFLAEKVEHEVSTANDKISTVAEKVENGLVTANDKISTVTEKVENGLATTNDKISTVTEKVENGIAAANDKISTVTEKVKNGFEMTNSKISILSQKVDIEASNMAAKVEREVKTANDKILIVNNLVDIESKAISDKMSILTDKVEHKISLMVAEVGAESRKELSSLADQINQKMEATNNSVLVIVDKLEQERQNINVATNFASKIDREIVSVNKNISAVMALVQASNKSLTDRMEDEQQNNSNRLMALEAKFMDNWTSANTNISHLEDKVGYEVKNANQKILAMATKVEKNQNKNSIYFDASR